MQDPREELLQTARHALAQFQQTGRGNHLKGAEHVWRDLAVKHRDARAAPILLAFSSATDKRLAQAARTYFASLGAASTASVVCTWLNELQPIDVESVAKGVLIAANLGYAEPDYARPVLHALARVVRTRAHEWIDSKGAMSERTTEAVYEVVKAMAALDPHAAWPILWSEDVFHVRSPALRPVVMYWTDADGFSPYLPNDVVPPPVQRVWEVYRQLDAGARVVEQRLRRATQAEVLCALTSLDPAGAKAEVARLKKLGLPKDDFVLEEAKRLSRTPAKLIDLRSLMQEFSRDRKRFRGNAAYMLTLCAMLDAVAKDGLVKFLETSQDDLEHAQFALIELGCTEMFEMLFKLDGDWKESPAVATSRAFLQRVERFERHFFAMHVHERIERYAMHRPRLFQAKPVKKK